MSGWGARERELVGWDYHHGMLWLDVSCGCGYRSTFDIDLPA